jgi:hypothetical protein
MPQFGGKDSKRHFTVVIRGKEHGLYVSSSPSSAAKKAVTKLCAANKGKKVEFHIREITQGSKKKTYGPYEGYIEKLKEPIELKGRVIKYKPVAKLSKKTGVKKGGMHRAAAAAEVEVNPCYHYRTKGNKIRTTALRINPTLEEIYVKDRNGKLILLEEEAVEILETHKDPKSQVEFGRVEKNGVSGWVRINYILQTNSNGNRVRCIFRPKLQEARELWKKSLKPEPISAPISAPRRHILPNINNFLLKETTKEKPTIFGLDNFQPNYGARQSASLSRLRGQAANFPGYQGEPASLAGLGRQAANFSREQRYPINAQVEDDLLKKVNEVHTKNPEASIEKVSNDKYIIHIGPQFRKIIERYWYDEIDHELGYQITETNSRGPLVYTEDKFDETIYKLIDSRMKSSQTRLSELLELCRNTYHDMFKKEIPEKKLRELESYIRSYPIIVQNDRNPTFYKI